MAIVKLEEVYLYVVPDPVGSTENLEAAAFMDHSDIPFTKLYYGDISQHQTVLDAVNTWWSENSAYPLPELTAYPFITYTEVHDDIPARLSPVKYAKGIDNIKAFVEMYNAQYK